MNGGLFSCDELAFAADELLTDTPVVLVLVATEGLVGESPRPPIA